jgi:hypothetical protein
LFIGLIPPVMYVLEKFAHRGCFNGKLFEKSSIENMAPLEIFLTLSHSSK